jgi:heptosyltransferase-1
LQNRPLQVLIVKLSSLGDVVQTIPVVHDILSHRPDAQIDWVVEEAFAPVLQLVAGVRRVIPIAQRRWRKSWWAAYTREQMAEFEQTLREQTYDVAIDVQGLVKSSLVMRKARMAPDGIRATFGNKSEACSYEWPIRFMANKLVPMPRRVHAVQRYRLLAAGVFGYEADTPPQYDINIRSLRPHKAVLFAHGTTRDDNLWPLPMWLELGQQLVAEGYEVWIPRAGERETAFAHDLAAQVGAQARVLPPMGLPELWHTMALATGVIGVDSGVSHMAVSLNLPHVQIFSQDRAWRAGPVGCAHQVAVGGAHSPTADEVWQAWQQVLAAKQSESTLPSVQPRSRAGSNEGEWKDTQPSTFGESA